MYIFVPGLIKNTFQNLLVHSRVKVVHFSKLVEAKFYLSCKIEKEEEIWGAQEGENKRRSTLVQRRSFFLRLLFLVGGCSLSGWSSSSWLKIRTAILGGFFYILVPKSSTVAFNLSTWENKPLEEGPPFVWLQAERRRTFNSLLARGGGVSAFFEDLGSMISCCILRQISGKGWCMLYDFYSAAAADCDASPPSNSASVALLSTLGLFMWRRSRRNRTTKEHTCGLYTQSLPPLLLSGDLLIGHLFVLHSQLFFDWAYICIH